jgi:hypothetical protein
MPQFTGVRHQMYLTLVDSGLLHFASLRAVNKDLAAAADPLLCGPFRSRDSPETIPRKQEDYRGGR